MKSPMMQSSEINVHGNHGNQRSGGCSSHSRTDHDDEALHASAVTASLAKTETRVVTTLRAVVLCVVLLTAVFVSTFVYIYTRNNEVKAFESIFESSAHQMISNFHSAVERNIGASASLSNQITAQALETNSTFPFVMLPNLAVRGSDARAQAGSFFMFWCPLVNDQNREEWEEYILEHRFEANKGFQAEAEYRAQQDYDLASLHNATQLPPPQRHLQEIPGLTVLDDGTGFHPKIYSNGAIVPNTDLPQGDGTGQYLPAWQQSPVDPTMQARMNVDIAQVKLITPGLIDIMQAEKKAILNHATPPIPQSQGSLKQILLLSQHRHQVDEMVGMHTMLSYPIFDSFDDKDGRALVGVVHSDIYWKVLLTGILPSNLQGVYVVVDTSAGQTFTYQLDGSVNGLSQASFVGLGEPDHIKPYEHVVVSANVNDFLQTHRNGPENKAYKTVPLSDAMQYTVRVYPGPNTADPFNTKTPELYTMVTVLIFSFAAGVFLAYSYVVEHRQQVMTMKVIQHVKKAAETERELNEFLAHEVRNPISAAITAVTFVASAVQEAESLKDDESRKILIDDVAVVSSSLHYVNDFLRSMLDSYQASDNIIRCAKTPTDVLQDIFEPVSNILYKRMANFEVQVQCPENLMVITDSIRLKQVVLNLVTNASKFVERGFVRMRAAVVNDNVILFVEDSGPGISIEQQTKLFGRYQRSLDRLSQGTGIGLNLSLKLMHILEGGLYLADDYDSGIEGCPGACFVIDLKTPPFDIDFAISGASESAPVDVESGLGKPSANKTLQQDEEQQLHFPGTTFAQLTEDDSYHSNKPTDAPCFPKNGASQLKKAPDGPRVPSTASIIQPVASTVDAEPSLPEGLSILFTDDDTMLRKLFMRAVKMVAPPSWTIQDAASGEAALNLCDGQQFDIIFMDQYMSNINKQLLGTETVSTMRAKGVTSKVCGLSANDLRDAFLNAGADDFVPKPLPCKREDLKKLLLRILFPAHGMQANMSLPQWPGDREAVRGIDS